VLKHVNSGSFNAEASDTAHRKTIPAPSQLTSEPNFRLIAESSADVILKIGSDGLANYVSPSCAKVFGRPPEELIGDGSPAFVLPEYLPELEELRARIIAGECSEAVSTFRVLRGDGEVIWVESNARLIRDLQTGEAGEMTVVMRDITDRKELEQRLATLAANFDIALSNMHQGLCLFDRDERLVFSNRRVFELFGITPGDSPPGTHYRDFLQICRSSLSGEPSTDGALEEAYRRHRACINLPEGGLIIAQLAEDCVLAITHRPLPEGGWVTTYEDITERRRTEERIAHMALHDSLTDLPNRAAFSQSLDLALKQAAGGETRVAAIAIDLDRFKEINDSRGHAAGDDFLKILATRLILAIEQGEFIARVGGDEFAAAKAYVDQRDLEDFIHRLEQALSLPIEIGNTSLTPAASIGIATAPQDGETRETLLNNADLAMYRAKRMVDQHICFYEPRMDEIARSRRLLAADIKRGMERAEFSLAYQVQRSLSTKAVLGYEALLRWCHPARGQVSPVEFIPIAEESGAILELGEWALRRACADAVKWEGAEKVAVNLSPVQFAHRDLPGLVRSILLETGLSPHRLELEITESTLIGDKNRALHILRQIKAMGVTIAIDDFGTGYSSLDTLSSFPFDKIKIDRSFLADASAKPQAAAIIRAVVALGQSMCVPVLAEGVETEEQLSMLQQQGCQEGQGYLLGRPGPYGGRSDALACASVKARPSGNVA
jgi:diguanylate cyclase (GGDEF)-like protein/PAS domain S-box-containing protein